MEGAYKYKCPLKDFLMYIQDYRKECLIHLNYNETGYQLEQLLKGVNNALKPGVRL